MWHIAYRLMKWNISGLILFWKKKKLILCKINILLSNYCQPEISSKWCEGWTGATYDLTLIKKNCQSQQTGDAPDTLMT